MYYAMCWPHVCVSFRSNLDLLQYFYWVSLILLPYYSLTPVRLSTVFKPLSLIPNLAYGPSHLLDKPPNIVSLGDDPTVKRASDLSKLGPLSL